MKMTYDREADALAVRLAEGRSVRTEHLARMVNADFDADGRLLGIEILAASDQYPLAELEALGSGAEDLSLAAAAKEAGLSPATLRVQLNAGRIPGEKIGRDWFIKRHDLWTYLENRGAAGRRPAARKGRAVRRRTSRTAG